MVLLGMPNYRVWIARKPTAATTKVKGVPAASVQEAMHRVSTMPAYVKDFVVVSAEPTTFDVHVARKPKPEKYVELMASSPREAVMIAERQNARYVATEVLEKKGDGRLY